MDSTGHKYLFLFGVVLVIGALVAIGMYSQKQAPPKPMLEGAGSSFVEPLIAQWSHIYQGKEDGCRLDYHSGGSGHGIELIVKKKVTFACTDGPLSDEQMKEAHAAGDDFLHIPLVLGAVVPVYNLPEVSEPLRFTGPVLADIYLGTIKKWNDKPIRDLQNSRIADQLPTKDIAVVHRSDGSGTTYIWTEYLGKVSDKWNDPKRIGLDITWPKGEAEPGNSGVAKRVKNTPYSIGYVELSYAFRKDLAYGLVENRAGRPIRASVDSIKATAANGLAKMPDDMRYSLTDPPKEGNDSYPICGTTWAIVRSHQSGAMGRQLLDFLYWAIEDGQAEAEALLYVPLPDSLREQARKQIAKIKVTN